MPNYRAVSAGVRPPPPTPEAGVQDRHPEQLRLLVCRFCGDHLAAGGRDLTPIRNWAKGFRVSGDITGADLWTRPTATTGSIWALPTVTHEDERYYAMGEGGILKRGVYAASRVLITPDYHGKNTFNASEIFGRGISQAISLTYYPSADQSLGPFMEKYGYAVGRDALTNVFREFWPDIDAHVIHRHRPQQ